MEDTLDVRAIDVKVEDCKSNRIFVKASWKVFCWELLCEICLMKNICLKEWRNVVKSFQITQKRSKYQQESSIIKVLSKKFNDFFEFEY